MTYMEQCSGEQVPLSASCHLTNHRTFDAKLSQVEYLKKEQIQTEEKCS